MGSDSDLEVMKPAADILEDLGIDYEIHISSAHRTPHATIELGEKAETLGVGVIIAGAGGAAHLPGVLAACTVLPVIGVPIKTSALSGVDSLYSIVQMPTGIPVATVAINGAANAGLLAAEILAVGDLSLRERLKEYRRKLAEQVKAKDQKLQSSGIKGYLESR